MEERDNTVYESAFLNSGFRTEKSWNGHRLDELKSGLQKYIRRGILDKALYCAEELDLFKHSPDRGETIRTNFLHRLMIIALEDIGVANLSILLETDFHIQALLDERKKADEDRDHVVESWHISSLVTSLVISPKARMCSHVRALANGSASRGSAPPMVEAIYKEYDERAGHPPGPELEDALRRRSWTSVLWAEVLANSTAPTKKYKHGRKPCFAIFRAIETVMDPSYAPLFAIMIRWFKELGTVPETFLCWQILIDAIVLGLPGPAYTAGPVPELETAVWKIAKPALEFDDYVLDKHTGQGRAHGKNTIDFIDSGSLVTNESPIVIPEFKAFYEQIRRGANAPRLESEFVEFVVRAQLTTSVAKTDVYFAIDRESGETLVIKGPMTKRDAAGAVMVAEWKRQSGIPSVSCRVEELVPDRWPEGVPLGMRNKLDRTKCFAFLVSDSIVPAAELVRRTHSSKVWPATEVVDTHQMEQLHLDYSVVCASDHQMAQYIRALLTRYIFMIGDAADRNFIQLDGDIIGIDEDAVGHSPGPIVFTGAQPQRHSKVCKWLADPEHIQLLELDRLGTDLPNAFSERVVQVQENALCAF